LPLLRLFAAAAAAVSLLGVGNVGSLNSRAQAKVYKATSSKKTGPYPYDPGKAEMNPDPSGSQASAETSSIRVSIVLMS